MSPQIETLQNLIERAKGGNEQAVVLVRSICVSAMSAAPKEELLAVAKLLCDLQLRTEKN